MVKFCSRYNHEVHLYLYCHYRGFAPRLISHSTICYYIVVVKEKLNLRSLIKDDPLQYEIEQQIKSISAQLKEQNYGYGDLRHCNILIGGIVNNKVVLILDWSGCHGIDLYSPFMNRDIEWMLGAYT